MWPQYVVGGIIAVEFAVGVFRAVTAARLALFCSARGSTSSESTPFMLGGFGDAYMVQLVRSQVPVTPMRGAYASRWATMLAM